MTPNQQNQWPSWIEICRAHYRNNLNYIKGHLVPGVELASVVKANAYGHGLAQVAALAKESGVRTFCVNGIDEAYLLRRLGIEEKILIMGHLPEPSLVDAVRDGFHVSIESIEALTRVVEIAARIRRAPLIHLKLDTGMHRQGVFHSECSEIAKILSHSKERVLEGVYTHFAKGDTPEDPRYVIQQLENFNTMVAQLQSLGIRSRIKHAAASSAALWFKETHFDLIRAGISQYGLWPSSSVEKHCRAEDGTRAPGLVPILTWKARIAQIKRVKKGSAIGYGCTYIAPQDFLMALIPVGYAEGVPRLLSNRGCVLVQGKRSKIVGNVCMNMLMIDVSAAPTARSGDEVVLLGRQNEEEIRAEEMATLSETINYEVVTRISPSLPRMVVD